MALDCSFPHEWSWNIRTLDEEHRKTSVVPKCWCPKITSYSWEGPTMLWFCLKKIVVFDKVLPNKFKSLQGSPSSRDLTGHYCVFTLQQPSPADCSGVFPKTCCSLWLMKTSLPTSTAGVFQFRFLVSPPHFVFFHGHDSFKKILLYLLNPSDGSQLMNSAHGNYLYSREDEYRIKQNSIYQIQGLRKWKAAKTVPEVIIIFTFNSIGIY